MFESIKMMTILVFILLLILFSLRYWILTYYYDFQFLWTQQKEPWKPYVNNNTIPSGSFTPHANRSLCMVTLDTRGEKYPFIQLHNQNLNQYVQTRKHGSYEYIFETTCKSSVPHEHNPYWCKFFVLRDLIESKKWDYVAWMDSDTVIADKTIDLLSLLERYDSHCFAGIHEDKYRAINSGVVIFKSSDIGLRMIQEITDTYAKDKKFRTRCIRSGGKLRGIFGQSCYEQAVLNDVLIKEKYAKHVTILPPEYIQNGHKCEGNFIVHFYAESPSSREKCFKKYI